MPRRRAPTAPVVLRPSRARRAGRLCLPYFANTISFLRIAAFALVHAGAFLALFALADTLAGRVGRRRATSSALVAGNVVIILLEGLTVSVQVLRLEYYEFFGKFFRGGGEPYRPLMLRVRCNKKEGGAMLTTCHLAIVQLAAGVARCRRRCRPSINGLHRRRS